MSVMEERYTRGAEDADYIAGACDSENRKKTHQPVLAAIHSHLGQPHLRDSDITMT